MKFFVANSKQNTCVHGVVEITIFNPAAAPSGADSRDIFFFPGGLAGGISAPLRGVPLVCPPYPLQQPLPSLRVSCLKIFPPTTTLTEISHPSANSSSTPAQLCRPGASQPSRGRSGLTPSLPKNKLETGQYKNSLCLEAAQ